MSNGQHHADQLERSHTVPSEATLAELHSTSTTPDVARTSTDPLGGQSSSAHTGLRLNETSLPLKALTIRTPAPSAAAHPLADQASDQASDSSPAPASLSEGGISPLASRDSFTDLAGQALAHSKDLGSKPRHETVSFAAIAKNPSLARLARAELDEHQHTTAIEKLDTDGPAASSAFYAHDAEVERQWTALEAVNAVTKEESTLNKELSALICARLEASRKSSERFLGVLQVQT